jgi:hypothetical protein
VKRLPVVGALIVLAACARPQGPEAAFRAFVNATASGQRDAAWALLSDASRKTVEAAWQEAKKAGGEGAPASPQAMLFSDDLRVQRRVKSITVASSQGDRTVLRVTDDLGESREVPMVREGGAWRVELTVPST